MRVKQRASIKPILMWSYTLPVPHTLTTLAETGYPIFTNMRNCARTLAVMTDYREARDAALRVPDIRSEASTARETTAAALRKSPAVLTEAEARPLLAAYGIGAGRHPSCDLGRCRRRRLQRHRQPVALKVQSPGILHKTEAGAVALKLATADDVRHGLRARARQRQALRPVREHRWRSRPAHGARPVARSSSASTATTPSARCSCSASAASTSKC